MATETTSPFANLFLKIRARLMDKVPELRYIERDLGQLEVPNRPPVSWPCALITVDEFEFSDIGGNQAQTGDGFVIIRLGLASYSSATNLTPDNVTLKALEYFDLEQKIHLALHGWRDEGFSKLLRRKSKQEQREDNLMVRVIPYAVSFEDYTTGTKTTKATRPGPVIGIA